MNAKNYITLIDGGLVVPNAESFALGFTQSEITTWDECAEKWFLSYNLMLRKKGEFKWYFVYGDAFHRTLQSFYNGEEKIAQLQFADDIILTGEQEAQRDIWQGVLDVQMKRYFKHYSDDLEAWDIKVNEEVVTVEWEGVKFTGKVDLGLLLKGQGEDGLFLIDHKSYGRYDPGTVSGWHFRFQFMFYMWLLSKHMGQPVTKFVVNGLKKPALKQGKAETPEAFVARVQQDMIQRPEEYFKRVPLDVTPHMIETFEDKILRPKLNRISLLTSVSSSAILLSLVGRNKNTASCYKYGSACSFLPICTNGAKAELFQYIQRENKHEELIEE